MYCYLQVNYVIGCRFFNLLYSSLILCLSCGNALNWHTVSGARSTKLANSVGLEAAA